MSEKLREVTGVVIKGVARLAGLGESRAARRVSSDAEAIRSDWVAVGKDLRRAMQVTRETDARIRKVVPRPLEPRDSRG